MQIKVNGAQASIYSLDYLTTGCFNYIMVNFTFSSDWDGLTKTAVFFQNANQKTFATIIDGVAVLPQVDVTQPLYIGAYGERVGSLRIATNFVKAVIAQGAYDPTATPVDPSYTTYVQSPSIKYIRLSDNALEYSEDGNVWESASVSKATSTNLGGVFANPKVASDTNPVRVDENGFLWTTPSANELPTPTVADAGKIVSVTNGGTYQLSDNDASSVSYDNLDSGLQSVTVQGAIDEVNNRIDNLNNIEILNKGIIYSTIANVQTTCTNYVLSEYGRAPKKWDALIITVTDSQPASDKIQYVYSTYSNAWVDTGSSQIEIVDASTTAKGIVQIGSGINVVGGVISVVVDQNYNANSANPQSGTAVAQAVSEKATATNLTATIGTTWTGTEAPFTQTIAVTGVLATDKPMVDFIPSDTFATAEAESKDWANIYRITTAENSITVYAKEQTTVALNIQILIVR